jgi:primosomal protein N'
MLRTSKAKRYASVLSEACPSGEIEKATPTITTHTNKTATQRVVSCPQCRAWMLFFCAMGTSPVRETVADIFP